MGDKELCLIDNNISSLLDIPLSPTVSSLNLHCNHIERIEGLASAWHLHHLDLSSNRISKIEGLSSLSSLRTLNLSCNLISAAEGLSGLVSLTRLNLSYNQINDLSGLLYLHGPQYQLKHLGLHSNRLDDIDHLLQCLLGLNSLREVTLSRDGKDNPICGSPGYRETVLQSLPQISVLDGVDRLGNPSGLSSLCDFPGLEDYVDLLLSSDNSHSGAVGRDGRVPTPRIDHLLAQFRQRIASDAASDPASAADCEEVQPACSTGADRRSRKTEQQHIQQVPASKKSARPTVRKAKRDTDRTSESECDSGKEIGRRTRIPKPRSSLTSSTSTPESRARMADSGQEKRKRRTPKYTAAPRRKAGGVEAAEPTRKGPVRAELKARSTQEEETYRAIVEERDQERERRWKAEQAVRKLTEELKLLRSRVSEEKDLQSMALHTTDRLKEVLLKERSGRSGLQARVEELEGRCRSLTRQLEQARNEEERHRTDLRRLQDSVAQGEALRARQQAEEVKRHQELENKAAALRRELDIQRAAVQQHKDKLQELHELLAFREQEHRQQLDSRLQPSGADFQEAVAKAVSAAEQRHGRREAELQERLEDGGRQYAALEDEFRMALTIEAARFSEVKEACEQTAAELQDVKTSLDRAQQRERKSGSLVQELTAVVKEQKSRISEILKAKKDAVAQLKSRLQSLEAEAGQDRRLGLQLELLKKDKARLLSQLTAQESVIDGLRAERKVWGQELAQQGASLAQDRGRLEARIEVLSSELDSQKKQAERDSDALKIKARIIDDQTETIRKLKESVQERDDQIRRLRDDAVRAQRSLQQQLEEEAGQQAELRERLEQLSLRKEELKQQLGDKEAELEELRRVYSDSSQKWQDKADLLTRLESQVMRMKDNFDSKERQLLEEREKAAEAHRAAVEKLHCVDDAFRRQLESVQASHQAELLRLANENQMKMEQANQKVIDVEEEMRQLLEETETKKRMMEAKMRRLTSVLQDF
ncbi:leucine-rich repeat and coiled-coil domain-containing protein 1 [Salarias fasciatus]|uniref:Leucine-rich repeat and coiled-coil domain-containing protein 1 n=1 Tax=Salarias fasciatus TaxID=181472 RepID=A0A672GMR9_SALFA|nr:leucine-rich repeat and coiled-coil domain-containing protein 1 [Salarias fasciatus]